MSQQYAKRDAEHDKWVDERFPTMSSDGAGVFDHPDAERIIREAFNAGWQGRKKAVDYHLNPCR